jgi:xanthine dehydrogenase YagS FAD-binding subunit
MVPFAYARAASIAAASASFARHRSDGAHEPGADFLAGGTDMMQLMGEHLRNPDRIIDISVLPGFDRIDQHADSLRLGALARMSDAAAHPAVRAECPWSRKPCWRVRRHRSATWPPSAATCSSAPAAAISRSRRAVREARARDRLPGHHRAEPLPRGARRQRALYRHLCRRFRQRALLVLDATIRIAGPDGELTIPIADLHHIPGDTPAVETQLAPGEPILSIDVPTGPAARRSHYLKVRDRASFEWSIASAAVALDLGEDGMVRDVRIAVGGVATKPRRLPQVEAALRGERPTPALAQEAAAHAADGTVPHGRNAYKLELIRRTVARALVETGALA